MNALHVLQFGSSVRLTRLTDFALAGLQTKQMTFADVENGLHNARILFLMHMDEYGEDAQFHTLLRLLRQHTACLSGCIGGIIIDGDGELFTKSAAQALALAANMAGCAFPGKMLVEGTGSLYNQHILAKRLNLSWEQTYFHRARQLAQLLMQIELPRFSAPKLLMLHASDQQHSNTVWMGREILSRLPEQIQSQEICLNNGTVFDCRGCSYDSCLHFAQSGGCYYGGAVSEAVLPAIADCDAMLFLCPNFNDALSANLSALINRLTNLIVRQELSQKYLFGIVVSGYSGSDLVARQLLGGMCLNKTVILPPTFCLMHTAHDPGSAKTSPGIAQKLDAFAAHIAGTLLLQTETV